MPQFPGQLGGDLVFRIGINEGAENDDAESVLRKHLNPALKGRGWNALIAAIATGEQKNWDNARSAFDQLFKISANGVYLERKAADDGVQKPPDIGMPDDLFRQYAINTTNGKLVESAILDILQVFYGIDSVCAHIDSATAEPFAIRDGYTLSVLLDEQDLVEVVFDDDDFDDLLNIRAQEVASAITRAFRVAGSTAFALANVDVQDGTTRVRIYSGALGLGSSVRVIGGSAQNILRFDTYLNLMTLPVAWNVTPDTTEGTTRFQVAGGTADLSQLVAGDYVTVYGTGFLEANRGTFVVLDVYYAYPGGVLTQYFDVQLDGVIQAGVIQTSSSDLAFFRPVRKTIYSASRTTVVADLGDYVTVVLPATSQAVGRGNASAAYAQGATASDITSCSRFGTTVTVDTLQAHGLSVDDHVFVDGVFSSPIKPGTTTGTVGVNAGDSDYSVASIWSVLAEAAVDGPYNGTSCLLSNGKAFVVGGDSGPVSGPFTPRALAQLFEVTAQTVLIGHEIQATYVSAAAASLPVALTRGAMTRGPGGSVIEDGAIHSGGINGGGTMTTATYLYDAGADSWSGVDTLNHARAAHSQTNLPNGTILVAGGASAPTTAIASAEIYDPAANTWTDTTQTMKIARCDHKAILLANGKVLVMGGRSLASGTLMYTALNNTGPLLASCEIYDPDTDTWTMTGGMTMARAGHLAQILPDGRVLVAGGLGYNATWPKPATVTFTLEAEIYDPATGRWAPCGRLTYDRVGGVMSYLEGRDQVVVSGGSSFTTELFDTETLTWTTGPGSLPWLRPGAVAVAMADGLVFTVGGYDTGTTATDTKMSLYIPNQDTWGKGGLNGLHAVTAVTGPTEFEYETEIAGYSVSAATDATVTPVGAPESPTILGPFTYDPAAGVAVTGVQATIQQDLAKGHQYATLEVDDATSFPDEQGWLVFAFGYDNQVAPVKYLGRLSDTSLSLDFGFKFTATVQAGAIVTLLKNKGAFVPDRPEQVGSFYLTNSSAGRIAASNAIDSAVAAGVILNKTIEYPGDRGLGNEGYPDHGQPKLSDVVSVWGSDDIDADEDTAREE
jgi:hypothetical protein